MKIDCTLPVRCALLAVVSILSFATVSEAQVDPAEGKAISAEFLATMSRCRTAESRWEPSNKQSKFHGTLDDRLIWEHLQVWCVNQARDIQQNIQDFYYDEARTSLQELKKHIAAAEIILSESGSTSIVTVRSESRTDEQTVPAEELPVQLSGRQLRARIASELSFAKRVTAKAEVDKMGLLPRYQEDTGTLACKSAYESFFDMMAHTVDSLGARKEYDEKTVNATESDAYFDLADEELSLLNYEASHGMAWAAYERAQRILSQCKDIR